MNSSKNISTYYRFQSLFYIIFFLISVYDSLYVSIIVISILPRVLYVLDQDATCKTKLLHCFRTLFSLDFEIPEIFRPAVFRFFCIFVPYQVFPKKFASTTTTAKDEQFCRNKNVTHIFVYLDHTNQHNLLPFFFYATAINLFRFV